MDEFHGDDETVKRSLMIDPANTAVYISCTDP
jgi:hypothetical protein